MSFPNVVELLPHRPPMLWIDEVLSQEGDEVRCRLTIRESHVFVEDDGKVEPIVAIEWMAQAVGALVGLYDRKHAQAPRPGYLIAIPEAQFFVDGFAVGDVLDIRARKAWGDASLASFECDVHCADTLASKAQLSVYRRAPGEAGGPVP